MHTRATTEEITVGPGGGPVRGAERAQPEPSAPPRWRARLAARVRGDYEEDGTFRPVRLSPVADWGLSLLVILFVVACWIGFFTWLAQTQ